jgi:uncharacterized membrane protein (UPF0182 family)
MVPFTPAKKDNMIAWMAARCDEPNYGKVLVFTFPKQRLVYGPQQIESRVDQDSVISPQLTLWDQHGSKVIRGTLLVIPVRDSVLYIEPLYLTAETGGGLPQLKRVIVAYSDHVIMEATLDAALSRIFGGALLSVPGQAPVTSAGPSAAVQPSAVAGTPAADVQSMYGEQMRKVGEILKRLSAR